MKFMTTPVILGVLFINIFGWICQRKKYNHLKDRNVNAKEP